MNKKMVSIVMPCYNQGSYIKEAINSVLQQSYTNWECIIVNDGSSDDSLKIIKNLIKNDSRFKLLDIDNKGVSNARNVAIEISSGEYILPLDGDDKIHPDYLKLAIQQFEKDPNTSLVYCNARYFGKKNTLFDLPTYTYEYLFHGNCIFCSAIYKRKDFYSKTTGYDIELIHGYEDWEFWLQLLDKNSKVVQLNKVLFYYRLKELSRNTLVLEENNLDVTLRHIYGKHYLKYLKNLGGDLKKNETSYSQKGVFIKYFKEHNLRLGSTLKNEENFILAEKFKKVKKTISYKLFVKLEMLIKNKVKF